MALAAQAVVLAAQAARAAAQAAPPLQAVREVAAVVLAAQAAQMAAQANNLWAVAVPLGLPQEAQASMCPLPRHEMFLLRTARRGAMMVSQLTRQTSPMR